jgi:hypothetical protein
MSKAVHSAVRVSMLIPRPHLRLALHRRREDLRALLLDGRATLRFTSHTLELTLHQVKYCMCMHHTNDLDEDDPFCGARGFRGSVADGRVAARSHKTRATVSPPFVLFSSFLPFHLTRLLNVTNYLSTILIQCSRRSPSNPQPLVDLFSLCSEAKSFSVPTSSSMVFIVACRLDS